MVPHYWKDEISMVAERPKALPLRSCHLNLWSILLEKHDFLIYPLFSWNFMDAMLFLGFPVISWYFLGFPLIWWIFLGILPRVPLKQGTH